MNKTKKLLSVLLAVVMLLSTMTVMASAARTSYREVSDLTTLEGYSPYGQVTRLSTEDFPSEYTEWMCRFAFPLSKSCFVRFFICSINSLIF